MRNRRKHDGLVIYFFTKNQPFFIKIKKIEAFKKNKVFYTMLISVFLHFFCGYAI